MSDRRLIVGCGYLGRRVAARWRDRGDAVTVVTRSERNAAGFRAEGYEAILADVTDPASLNGFPDRDTLLFAVGYDRAAGKPIQEVYVDGFANTLAALGDRVGRVTYISTTGVYGDAGGDWIDESSPPDPSRPGGVASLAAEQALRAGPLADSGVTLRLAGIYGPDRLPYLAKLRAGEPLEATPEGWLNLIHVDDAASAVVAATDADSPPKIVCVSDGAPPRRGDYYAEVARLLGAPAPRFSEPPTGSPRAARAAANKRVRNTLLLERLGVKLGYPSYREGLAAILAGEGGVGC